ncbi:hypothetical protein ENBRE01_3523, partial [Enteropsectra breve]
GNINFTQAQEGAFVAKVKKIKDGLLFIMANNVFVFDFNFGTRVAIGEEGAVVYAFNDHGPVDLNDMLLGLCSSVLKMYCGNR